MKISVFGLGYVGTVSCGCLARDGHHVIGVDINSGKVAMINGGKSPIVENEIDGVIRAAVQANRLCATTDVGTAVGDTDLSIICVGTPSHSNGSLNLGAVEHVADQIGTALKQKNSRHTIVLRSTVLPGTTRGVVLPRLASSSGRTPGQDFHLVFNPEFLREGTSVKDYDHPPLTLIGCDQREAARTVAQLYAQVVGEVLYCSIETAEMLKYVCNAWHALKVTFANEVAIIAQALQVDGHEVMQLFCKDTKLNISSAYLRPGFAFGGSCLPKDLSALRVVARHNDLDTPLLHAISESNSRQIQRAINLVLALGKKPVTVLGLSFKAGTDDLRESPIVLLAEALIGKGFSMRIYDRNVSFARLVGANRQYIEKEIPHISSLIVADLSAAVVHADVVIIGNDAPEFRTELPSLLRHGQTVLDLVHIPALAQVSGITYQGIV